MLLMWLWLLVFPEVSGCIETRNVSCAKAWLRVTTYRLVVTSHIWKNPVLYSNLILTSCSFLSENVSLFLALLHCLGFGSLDVFMELLFIFILAILGVILPTILWSLTLWFVPFKRQFSHIGHAQLMESIVVTILIHLSELLARVGDNDIGVNFLLPVLHHLKFGVDDLNDAIEHHVVVKVKLWVKIMLLLQAFEVFSRALDIMELTLQG